jgi:hypothetical protein
VRSGRSRSLGKLLLESLLLVLLGTTAGCSITPINLPLEDGGNGAGFHDKGFFKGADGGSNSKGDFAEPVSDQGWQNGEAATGGDALPQVDGKKTDACGDSGSVEGAGRTDAAGELPVGKE